MSRRTTFIKVALVFLVSINMTVNLNKQQEMKTKYLLYTNQEFESNLKIRKFVFQQQFVKPIEEYEVKEKQIKMEKQQEVEKPIVQEETFVLTFYTSLIDENSSCGPVTCHGNRLREGIVANNVLSQGTRISTKGYGELVVADRGGNNFNTSNRLDVFVSRENGEDDYQYKKRVESMGVVKIKGHIIK